MKSYSQWKEFAKGYTQVTVRLSAEDVFSMSPLDKEKTLQQKVRELFSEKDVEVYRYRHDYNAESNKEYWGLVYHRADSEITDIIEITALIGVNARYKVGVDVTAKN